jgi:hypothetical protein
MPESINNIVLILIPNVKNPQELTNFRPIALCNVIYKICSMAIANRLRQIIDVVISEEQSPFIPGRLITDNVLIAYESIHYLKWKKGQTGACAMKLDMTKAYDRVEWSYLRTIMLRMGFSGQWVDLIMRSVESVRLSFRLEAFDKVICCPPTFFFYVLKVSPVFLSIQDLIFWLRGFEWEFSPAFR